MALAAADYDIDFELDSVRENVRGFLGKEPVEKKSPKKKHAKSGEQEVRGFITLNETSLKTGVTPCKRTALHFGPVIQPDRGRIFFPPDYNGGECHQLTTGFTGSENYRLTCSRP